MQDAESLVEGQNGGRTADLFPGGLSSLDRILRRIVVSPVHRGTFEWILHNSKYEEWFPASTNVKNLSRLPEPDKTSLSSTSLSPTGSEETVGKWEGFASTQ